MRTIQATLGCLAAIAMAAGWFEAGAEAATPAAAAAAAEKAAPAMTATPALPTIPPLPTGFALPYAPAVNAPPPPAPVAPPEGEVPGTLKPAFPYAGYVNAEAVRLRSGPGLYYYWLATVNSGTPVVIEGEADGWMALRPTSGVYGLVRKSEVDLSADGRKATVLPPSARVYSASNAADRRWCVMATLKQGDSATVLGPADAEFIKVAPPDGARIYVVSQYVTAGPGAAGIGAAIAQLTQPPKTDPHMENYKKADAALDEEMKKPLGERDYKSAAAAFKEIAEKTDKAYLRRAALDKMSLLKGLEEQQAGYVRVMGIADRLDRRIADIKAQEAAKAAQAEREKKLARPEFTASGMLQPMESLEDVDYPIKFKLVDPNNHPLVVLKSTTYDLSKYAGKVVGVRGPKTYLKDWRIYLVTVDDLEVIE